MLKAELLEIIGNGEGSGIEFKRDDIRPEQLAKEVVALCNFKGGRLLLGVEDDGSISGVQRTDLEEWVMNCVQSKVHPIMLPFFEVIKFDNDRSVAVVSFLEGISKPYVMRHGGKEDIYVRVGSTSQLATREQQMWLFEAGGMLHAETMPVPRTDISCLDNVRLTNYLADILNDPDVPGSPEAWLSRLLGLSFLVEVQGTVYCSIAGLLLFGKSPRRYLKQAGLRLMVFKHEDKEYQAELDEILDGPLVGRWDVDASGKRLLDGGVIERFVDAITAFVSQQADSVNAEFRRDTQWFYARDALREVVVNALAHRDWTRFVDIEVSVYSDRLEVISPGTLPNSMTIEKMKAGQRSPRNSIVMDVLRDYGYVDARGMGIRTKVVPLTRALSGRAPEFVVTDDYLKTTLYRSV
ncbi:ATP-binding protein [Granulosicoccus antarcticus]|uniref:Schlafen AlbA-2 domain-containing protein n=1 Tax=Granulosicoccus antarcticus IMCC3135 TaxID=1192854 RepID=A0A2Z2NKZ2_9GAMM|nr:ATP-binding protein [Granulosicoccus antarcticus]ASJ70671.1 hypothetical protein IMCC3135_02790 [Granulosicoccus antarcticus IMCC3135]